MRDSVREYNKSVADLDTVARGSAEGSVSGGGGGEQSRGLSVEEKIKLTKLNFVNGCNKTFV